MKNKVAAFIWVKLPLGDNGAHPPGKIGMIEMLSCCRGIPQVACLCCKCMRARTRVGNGVAIWGSSGLEVGMSLVDGLQGLLIVCVDPGRICLKERGSKPINAFTGTITLKLSNDTPCVLVCFQPSDPLLQEFRVSKMLWKGNGKIHTRCPPPNDRP